MTSASITAKRTPLDFNKLYFPNLQREMAEELLRKHGDFLLRRAGEGGRVLSVNRKGEILHFKFGITEEKKVRMDGKTFDSLESLVTYYYETGAKLAGKPDVELHTPVYNSVELIDYSRLTFLQELGRGNFGQVWRATLAADASTMVSTKMVNENVAVKILADNTTDQEREECLAEARLMTTVQHENVVRLKGLGVWKEPDSSNPPKLLLVLEYCDLGSLDKLLEKDMVGKKGKEKALLDAARGIEYLHSRQIIHRDIASRNCLVQKPSQDSTKFNVKIGDFGLSRVVEGHYKLITKRRLPVFSTAPETLKTRDWTFASDVWTFGILMLEVYNNGKNPYEAHFGTTPLKQIVTELLGGFRLPPPKDMPPELGQLALRCMAKEAERPKMSEVVADLSPFYNRSGGARD